MKLFDIRRKHALPTEETALAGRPTPMEVSNRHAVHGRAICPPMPEHLQQALFGMGCFWGVERKFWQQEGGLHDGGGVRWRHHAQSYLQGGLLSPNRTQRSGTGRLRSRCHRLRIAVNAVLGRDMILPRACVRATMWAPSTAVVFTGSPNSNIWQPANPGINSSSAFETRGYGDITTEILAAPTFYYAEDYHQQYLHKNPGGYCGWQRVSPVP